MNFFRRRGRNTSRYVRMPSPSLKKLLFWGIVNGSTRRGPTFLILEILWRCRILPSVRTNSSI